jgi:integrase
VAIRKRHWIVDGIERSRWVVNYTDMSGKRRLKTFSTKKEAVAFSIVAHHEVKRGIHTPASISPTVVQATELWIRNSEAEGLELATIKQRQSHLRVHIQPYFGTEKLASLTTPRITQFLESLRDGGTSAIMRRKALTTLKATLKYSQSKGWVAQNVAAGIQLKSDGRDNKGPLREGFDFPTKAELRKLMDTAVPNRRPLVVTAIFTGMRISELRGLRWTDVDLKAGEIHVRQRADNYNKIGRPKSKAGSRNIPLPPMVIHALKTWKLACPRGDLDLVFPAADGSVESYFSIRRTFWIPLLLDCGIADSGRAKYSFHSLRHAAASLFIAHLGWTPKRLQAVMGHASIAMTFDTYGHLFTDPDDDRQAMKKLEAAVLTKA